jgi:DNA-binding winged helix-turn-helix (wHTH) protein/tetratricopeptide (TPR) repeat protein
MNILYRFDDFELNPARRSFTRSGEAITLAPKTFDVLAFLAANPGRVLLKQEILDAVWPGAFVEEGNLTQHIFWIRKALGDRASAIVTIPGRGYHFIVPVEIVDLTPPEAATTSALPALPAASNSVLQPSRRRTWALIAATVLLLTALTASAVWRRLHAPIPGDHHEIVLADFENSTGDPTFDHTLKTLLAIDLSQSPYLAVASTAATGDTLKLMNRPADQPLTPALAREVCERLNDQVVLSGTIGGFGSKYLVTLVASDCTTGKDLVETKEVASGREAVLSAVNSIAAEMRKRLGEPLKSIPNAQRLQTAHTSSLDALRAYSQATAFAEAVKCQPAIPLYQRAVELDPQFAVAYAGLSECYFRGGDYGAGEAAITKAYTLRNQAGDADRFSIAYHYDNLVTSDLFAALRDLQSWTDEFPGQTDAWMFQADILKDMGRPDAAIDAARHAVALDPDNRLALGSLARDQVAAGRFDAARATAEDAIRRKADSSDIHYVLYDLAYLAHDQAAMDAQVAWAHGKRAEAQMTLLQAKVAAEEGKVRLSEQLMQTAIALYKTRGQEERARMVTNLLIDELAEFGLTQRCAALLHQAGAPNEDGPEYMVALAETGKPDEAEAAARKAAPSARTNTEWYNYAAPWIESAIALARHQPQQAITALQAALVYDLHDYTLPYMRGKAYLAAGQPDLAQAEFHKILDHPGIEPEDQYVPLAHLGLARALAAQAKPAAARKEYEALLTMWKDADTDLPALRQARAEHAAIR